MRASSPRPMMVMMKPGHPVNILNRPGFNPDRFSQPADSLFVHIQKYRVSVSVIICQQMCCHIENQTLMHIRSVVQFNVITCLRTHSLRISPIFQCQVRRMMTRQFDITGNKPVTKETLIPSVSLQKKPTCKREPTPSFLFPSDHTIRIKQPLDVKNRLLLFLFPDLTGTVDHSRECLRCGIHHIIVFRIRKRDPLVDVVSYPRCLRRVRQKYMT